MVDVGPFAGTRGGTIVFEGSFADLLNADTLTGRHMKQSLPIKSSCRAAKGKLSITNARANNLQNVSVDIPTGVLTVVTGVAGSGKSSLIHQVFLRQYVLNSLNHPVSTGRLRSQAIARMANRFDRRFGPEFLAQPADADVDDIRVWIEVITPDLGEQPLAADDLAGAFDAWVEALRFDPMRTGALKGIAFLYFRAGNVASGAVPIRSGLSDRAQ